MTHHEGDTGYLLVHVALHLVRAHSLKGSVKKAKGGKEKKKRESLNLLTWGYSFMCYY